MKTRSIFIVALVLALWGAVYIPTEVARAQQTFYFPTVYQVSSTVVGWTGGTVNNGGHPVTITGGTASVTTNQTDCAAPGYVACNIVWANSGGTVTVTAASNGIVTASASGNTILAYVETTGAGAITQIISAQQTSNAIVPNVTMTDCSNSATCATKTPRAMSVRVFTGAITVTSGSAVTITGMSPAFTSTSTYGCTTSVVGSTSTTVTTDYRALGTDTITLLIAGTTAPSETVRYTCMGY